MQIKVSLDEPNYKSLKENAKVNRRTLSAELNTILDKLYGHTVLAKGKAPAATTTSTSEATELPACSREEMLFKIKNYLDTFNIPVYDARQSVLNECKVFMEENIFNRPLTPEEIDISMLDEVQEERRKEYAKENNK